MTTCPKCGVRPSRKPQRHRGITPHCAECFRSAMLERQRRYNQKRPDRWKGYGRARMPQDETSWPGPDLSPAAIEKRFKTALAAVRGASR